MIPFLHVNQSVTAPMCKSHRIFSAVNVLHVGDFYILQAEFKDYKITVLSHKLKIMTISIHILSL